MPTREDEAVAVWGVSFGIKNTSHR
jgi:hypothetical protein